MRKPESAGPAKRSGRLRHHRRLRGLHRWFGLVSLVFILLLSLTGLGLNHAAQWGLDERYVEAPWVMAWYGFEAPEPGASFAVGGARITHVGNRVYLGSVEAVRGVDALVGAVAWKGFFVAATPRSLLYLSPDAELLDRLDLAAVSGPVEAIARAEETLVLRSEGRAWALDERTLELTPRPADDRLIWATASSVPAPLTQALSRSYRGPGVSVERLLLDLHNGQVFARAGPWLLDTAGILLVVLSVTGLVLWVKRRS